jgi:glutathione synthase/RimK-type ligase-like ATP-grasp enzyme
MKKIIVVNNPQHWNLKVPDAEVVSAKDYLTNPQFLAEKNVRIFNLCKEYRYQSKGYYVSLLADARGHKPIPDVKNILDLRAPALVRVMSEDLDDLIQRNLNKLKSEDFTLSIYFGKNVARQYDKLSLELHKLFQAPFLRARFTYNKKWLLQSIKAIPYGEIPEYHHEFVQQCAQEYFNKKRYDRPRSDKSQYYLGILINPKDTAPPSNKQAIEKFISVAEKMGFSAETITRDDYSRIPAFDALFIRDTTHVNNDSYRFARRAESEGLAVIDSPDTILKCGNKVYLAELLNAAKVPQPKSMIVQKENRNQVMKEIGLPCVLKLPDSSFSLGVQRADTEEDLKKGLSNLLKISDLVLAQEYSYSDFDWRIGIIDGVPLYACKYFMAKDHWQIYNWKSKRKSDRAGEFETIAIKDAPPKIIEVALKATNLIGKGLFGVDIKEINGKPLVIEVNDNPNLDFGIEDQVIKDELYIAVIEALKNRIEGKTTTKSAK